MSEDIQGIWVGLGDKVGFSLEFILLFYSLFQFFICSDGMLNEYLYNASFGFIIVKLSNN